VSIPDVIEFFNLPNRSSRTIALGSTQTLTETSTRNLPGGEWRLARKADNLTADCLKNMGAAMSHKPVTQPVTGIDLFYFFYLFIYFFCLDYQHEGPLMFLRGEVTKKEIHGELNANAICEQLL
jgi:hypothetical protein